MNDEISYEIIDTNNVDHLKCLKDIWEDHSAKEFFVCLPFSFTSFISSFSKSNNPNERLININGNYVGWIEFFDKKVNNENLFQFNFIICKNYRGLGYGRKVTADIINKYKNVDAFVLEIRKDNSFSKAIVESLGFSLIGKNEDGMLDYRLDNKKQIL